MKKLVFLAVVALMFFSAGCSSVDSDAKEAAELNNKSMEYIKNNDLLKADELYKESVKIMNKYKDTDQYKEFYAAYNKYLLKDKTE